MYDETSSSDEAFEHEHSRKARGKKPKKSTKQELTWAEAAEIVLSKSERPLPHKEILRLIEESNLKTRGRGNSAPLTILNSMLNSHCKGPGAVFYRAPGSACFGLVKNRTTKETKSSPLSNNKLEDSDVDIKPKYGTRMLKPGMSSAQMNQSHVLPQKQLIPPGGIGAIDKNRLGYGLFSQAAYERLKQHPLPRRMGPTTAALIRPAPPCSRPPPGAALRVMPPKKRVKLDDDSDSDNSSKSSDSKKDKRFPSRQPSPLNSQHKPIQRNTPNITNPPVLQRRESQRTQNKLVLKASEPDIRTSSRNNIVTKIRTKPITKNDTTIASKPMFNNSRNSVKINPPSRNVSSLTSKLQSTSSVSSIGKSVEDMTPKPPPTTFLGVTFKRMKKANLADQIKRSKEGKLDLMTPDSILTSVNLKDFLTESTFRLLPPSYQYQLLMLLPECDRKVGNDGALRLTPQSLNNGFFNRSCQEFKDKLMDGEFNSDIIQRAKNEVNLYNKLDPWKKKFFEPTYGNKTLDDPIATDDNSIPPPVKPIETSWKVFLKFAENSTDDFEKALAKIQEEAQKKAIEEASKRERERKKKQKECLKRLSLSPASKHTSKKLSSLTTNTKSSTHTRSPVSLKQKFVNRIEGVNKEKCRRAVKKAHQLQRKKAFDKQLQDAKARLVEEARFGARNINLKDTTLNKNENINASKEQPVSKMASNITEKENELCSDLQKTSSESPIRNDSSSTLDSSSVIDLRDNSALRKLIEKSDTVNNKTNSKKKSVKTSGSRIAIGPSSFNGTGNVCPCNLKAMVTCSKCGSLWHRDCMNGTKICYVCAR